MTRHVDFQKIYATFMQHYSKDPKLGEERYAEWVKLSGLDDSQGYYAQATARAKSSQSFDWAKFLLQFVKEDQSAKYYKVEALFPVESMNKDSPPFTREEVLQSARSLTGKSSNLNHDAAQMLEGVEVVAAQFEDDCVECLVRVPKGSPLIGLIDRKEIVSVSVEGEWSHGLPGCGLVLTGLAWLTKQSMLPGIPLTRIVPVEQMVETFEVTVQVLEHLKAGKRSVKLEAQQGDGNPACSVCGEPAGFLVSICQGCLDKAGGAEAQVLGNQGSEKMEREALIKIVHEGVYEAIKENLELLSSRVNGERSLVEKLRAVQDELAERKAALAEVEGKLAAVDGKLAEANSTVEKLKELVPSADLLQNPSKLMPVSEVLERLGRLELSKMHERLSLGNQVQAQKVRREIFEVKQKYGVSA